MQFSKRNNSLNDGIFFAAAYLLEFYFTLLNGSLNKLLRVACYAALCGF